MTNVPMEIRESVGRPLTSGAIPVATVRVADGGPLKAVWVLGPGCLAR
jgi:hypothetical protein